MKSVNQVYKLCGFLFVAAIVFVFSSCKKDSAASYTALGNSRILLINSAANSSAIDLYWTGNKLNTVPLVYGNTTGYRNVTSGIRDVQVKANGTNKLLATNTIHLLPDSSYTIFVFEANNTTTTIMAEDDLSAPSFGNAKIKFANMSSGLSSADLAISNGPTIFSSVSFSTVGTYAELKAGTYNLTLSVHGNSAILFNLPNFRVDNGKIYTIWSSGSINGTATSALAVKTITQ